MFSKNNEISKLQMKRLLILDLFATTVLIVPGLAVKSSGKAGVLSIILGGVISLIYAAYLIRISKMYPDNYFGFMKRCVGKFFAWVFMFFYAIKFLISAVYVLTLFTEVIRLTFLAEMSKYVLAAAMLIVVGYGAVKGIEARGRMGEIMFYFVVLPVLVIVLLSVSEIRLENLFPIIASDKNDIFYGGYLVFSTFSVLELLLFVSPFVKDRKHIYRSATGAIMCVSFILILLFVACVGIFTVNGVANEQWPTVILMQVVSLPGGFLSRQDGLMLAFWMGSVFILLSGYLFYLGEVTAHGLKSRKWQMIGWALIIFALFCLCRDFNAYSELYLRYLVYIVVPSGIILPGLFGLIHILKQGGKSGEKK